MSDEHAVQSALNSAYYFLKFRPRTKWEVERNLKKKAVTWWVFSKNNS
jgi:SOS response regulatory protein OraA/RecX